MRTRMYLKPAAILLIISMLFVFLCPAWAAGETTSAKEINIPPKKITVVLDNSGSMADFHRIDYSCYALEVLSAMMGEKDELKLYTLNKLVNRTLFAEIQGSDVSRIQELHGTLSYIHEKVLSVNQGTPYDTVNTVINELLSSSDNKKENWLVILSDGAFLNRTTPEVQKDLNGLNDKGVHTVFMSIDPGPDEELKDNGDKGKYVKSNSSDILKNVSYIANMIFNHLALPDNHITKNGDTYTLNIDIPIDQLIVFAQGQNADIKSVKLGQSEMKSTAEYPVESIKQNRVRLKGVVNRFDQTGGMYYDSGTYQVTVSGADTVDFYYRPAVDLMCSIVNSGQIYTGDKQKAEVYFAHPKTGAKVTSDLLAGAEIYLTITNNGKKLIDNEKADPNGEVREIELELGTAEVSAYANLPGYVSLKKLPQKYNVVEPTPTVEPPPPPTPEPASGFSSSNSAKIRQIDLKNNNTISFLATIVKAEDHSTPVDQDTWEKSTSTADDQYGISLKFSKDGVNYPDIRFTPVATGKLSDVQTGELKFTVHTGPKGGGMTDSNLTIFVIPYEPIMIVDTSKTINQASLGGNNTTEYVEIKVVDKETGADLSDEVFRNTELNVKKDSGKGLNWKVEKGKNGIWKLTPQASGKKMDISTGLRTVELEAVYDDGSDFTAGKAIKTTGVLNLTVDSTPPRALDVSVSGHEDPFLRARWDLEKHTPIEVKATYGGRDLPPAAWNDAQDESLQLEWDHSKFDLHAEKSSTPGVWNVYVRPVNGKGYQTAYGTFDVKAEINFTDYTEEVAYGGTGSFDITLEPDWLQVLWEFWCDWWWAIIGSIILAGYLFKKKLAFIAWPKMRKIGVSYVKKGKAFGQSTTTTPKNIRLKMWSFLLPFVAQRVVIQGSHGPANCTFGDITAKAVKRIIWNIQSSRFTITNKNFSLADVSAINNITKDVLCKPGFDINKKEFKLIGFNIQGEGRNGDVKVIKKK